MFSILLFQVSHGRHGPNGASAMPVVQPKGHLDSGPAFEPATIRQCMQILLVTLTV